MNLEQIPTVHFYRLSLYCILYSNIGNCSDTVCFITAKDVSNCNTTPEADIGAWSGTTDGTKFQEVPCEDKT